MKKIIKNIITLSLLLIIFASCSSVNKKNDEKLDKNLVKRVGVIKPIGFTTWMYGTNILVEKDGNIISALVGGKSIRLVDYEGHDVQVIGELKDGYPIDGGPEYVEVEKIKVIHK